MGKSKGKITAKSVQASEGQPFTPHDLDAKAEEDISPWDAEGLTPKRLMFVNAYVGEAGGDGSKAALIAGYNCNNVNSLRATASRTLNDPAVSRAVASRIAAKFAALDGQELRSALARLARADLSNFVTVDDDGTPRLDFLKARNAAALGQIKEFRAEGIADGSKSTAGLRPFKVSIKVHDPKPAIELLSKMAGMLVDRHEHVINQGDAARQTAATIDADPQAAELADKLADRLFGAKQPTN